MGKQMPLVMYKDGSRTVLGMASIQDDGSIEAKVSKDAWPTIKDYILPYIVEIAISPTPPIPKDHPYKTPLSRS